MVQLVSNLFLNLLGFFEQWVRAVLESIALKAMLVAYAEAVLYFQTQGPFHSLGMSVVIMA